MNDVPSPPQSPELDPGTPGSVVSVWDCRDVNEWLWFPPCRGGAVVT